MIIERNSPSRSLTPSEDREAVDWFGMRSLAFLGLGSSIGAVQPPLRGSHIRGLSLSVSRHLSFEVAKNKVEERLYNLFFEIFVPLELL